MTLKPQKSLPQKAPPPPKKGRGRPAGKPVAKIKLKPSTRTAKELYYKKYGEIGVCAVYGIDEFTDALIDYLWNHPEMEIIVTDPDPSKVDNINKKYGARSFSAYRWHTYDHRGFIQECPVGVVVVSKDLIEEVLLQPNPDQIEFVVLEEL